MDKTECLFTFIMRQSVNLQIIQKQAISILK